MSNQYFNFYYSPSRQGFDSSAWTTLFNGGKIQAGTKLQITNAGIVHAFDLLRADAIFSLNITAPTSGQSKRFGLAQISKNAYAYFHVSGAVFTAECSDGMGHTTSVPITWQDAWSSADTEFRVQWEAGRATFWVGGIVQAVINDASVPGDPMSLYLSSETASETITVNYIDVKTIQSLLTAEINSGAVFNNTLFVSVSDRINVSESTTELFTILNVNGLVGVVDSINVFDESLNIEEPKTSTMFDSVNITESVSVSMTRTLNVSDSLTVTDVRTVGSPS